MLLRLECSPNEAVGNFHAADELHDDVDVVSVHHIEGIVDERDARIERTNEVKPFRIHVGGDSQSHGRAYTLRDDAAMLHQDPCEALADHTAATEAHSKLAIQITTSSESAR